MIAAPFLGEAAIAARVRELGAELSRDYAGRAPLLVGVLASSCVFLADVIRAMHEPAQLDFLAISSYARERARGSGRPGVRIEKDLSESIEGRHVIIIEDIVDTGLTLQYVLRTLSARLPASLAVCALLDRPQRRIADIKIAYRGFEIPDVFVAGYGMDRRGRYRELPGLHTLEPE